MATEIIFVALIGVIALMYAAVGHGGASGYLALMALFSFNTEMLRSSALILNVFVAGISFFQYYRNGHFKFKLFLPFAIGSIPLSYLGGSIAIDPNAYKKILGLALIFAILRLLGLFGKETDQRNNLSFFSGVLIGGILGFVSGLIGIGGGIILSPIILLFHWANMKTTAAVSALFILVNSVSGLVGLYFSGNFNPSPNIMIWIVVALIGGAIGAYSGSSKLSSKALKNVLAIVLIFASIKLIFL